ncbi:MAG: glycosyltransferase family 2 protein [Myxococcota bacterium]
MTEHEPLVSVMIPCFNAETTLRLSLASLTAQTYEHWEAVIVDDGSTDKTPEILRELSEPRIRVDRYDTNRGRGAARQRCLEMAQGSLLAFLDADDWLFPGKLAHQVDLMRRHPNVVVLGGACVITGPKGEAVGETRTGLPAGVRYHEKRFERLGPPPIGFPPCMVRMEAAKRARFNPEYRRSQDSEFLLRVMLGRDYAVSATPVYAYSQAEAANLDKTLEGYRYRLRCYGQYLDRYPLRARTNMAKTIARMGVYRAAGMLGAERHLINRRWAPLHPDRLAAFEQAEAVVEREAERHRGVA